jgi:hypothetical protein
LEIRLDCTTLSKAKGSPCISRSSHLGISLDGGSSSRSLEGPSLRFTSDRQCRRPGYKPEPKIYHIVPCKTLLRAKEEDLPFAAAPIVTRESKRPTTLESCSVLAQDFMKDLYVRISFTFM